MMWLDVVLLIIISGFALLGFVFGLIHTLGALIGIIAGAYIANNTYEMMTPFFANIITNTTAAQIVAYIIIFTITNRLIGLVFGILDKALSLLTIIPFLGIINRIMGASLGFLEGVFSIGTVLYFTQGLIAKVPAFQNMLYTSTLATTILNMTKTVIEIFI